MAVAFFVELLLSLPHGVVAPNDLDRAAEAVLHKFKANGWGKYLIKKFHWLLHMGDSLAAHKILIPCFCMERKHKQVTKVGVGITNMQAYPRTCLEELLSKQLWRLQRGSSVVFKGKPHLEQEGKAPAAFKEYVTSMFPNALNSNIFKSKTICLATGGSASKGDLVLVSSASGLGCGKLLCCFQLSPEDVRACLHKFALLENGGTFAKWQELPIEKNTIVVTANDIMCSVTWSSTKNGVVTLLPLHFRS